MFKVELNRPGNQQTDRLFIHPPFSYDLVSRCGWGPWSNHTIVKNITHIILNGFRIGLVAGYGDGKRALFNYDIDGIPDYLVATFNGGSILCLLVKGLQ